MATSSWKDLEGDGYEFLDGGGCEFLAIGRYEFLESDGYEFVDSGGYEFSVRRPFKPVTHVACTRACLMWDIIFMEALLRCTILHPALSYGAFVFLAAQLR